MGRMVALSPEQVVDAAFEIARAGGLGAVSVRSIGAYLGCSTQPVYTACGSMKAVQKKVLLRVESFVEAALHTANEGPPLLSLGFATLKLAQGEPHLFEIIVQHIRARAEKPPAAVLAAMRIDSRLSSLSRQRLMLLHEQLWFLTLGLSTMLTTDKSERAMTRAKQVLSQSGEAFIHFALKGSHRE